MSNLFPKPDATYGTGSPWAFTSGGSGASFGVAADGVAYKIVEGLQGDSYVNYTGYSVPVTAGTTYTFSLDWRTPGVADYLTVTLSFNAGSSVVMQDVRYIPVDGLFHTSSVTFSAPVGATGMNVWIYVRDNPSTGWGANKTLEFKNVYLGAYAPDTTNEPTPPPPTPEPDTGLDIKLEIGNKVIGDNLITNPHGDPTPFGWVPSNPSYAQVSTSGVAPLSFIRGTAKASQPVYYLSEWMDIEPSLYTGIRLRWGGFSGGARIGIQIDWFSATNVSVGSTSAEVINPDTATDSEYNRTVQAPANAYRARVRLDQYRWTGNNDKPLSGDYIEWREATVLQSAVIGDVDNLAAWQADTSITWTDVIEPSHEIAIDRSAMESGYLSATVLKDEYAPSVGGIIRPGAAVRCSARRSDGVWERLYTGKIRNVNVEYPNNKTRIYFTASDNMTVLNNQKEARGVKEIEELPYLLDGMGVPWNINGSQNTVGSITQVSSNDSATLLDQILITRDSDNAYTWIDRNNVFNAMTRPTGGTPEVEFSDVANAGANYDSYLADGGIDVSFSTEVCINVIDITYLRYDNVTGETEEIKYGPYTDDASISAWGAYKATFTLHGISENETTFQNFANAVFAKNANPVVRANSIVVPVKDARSRTHAAVIDLYDLVGVKYADKVDSDIRVTAIKHEITPDKWLVEYTFEKADSVAVPLVTPGVTNA